MELRVMATSNNTVFENHSNILILIEISLFSFVTDYLQNCFGDRFIAKGQPIDYPARSPDLTICDIWGFSHLKSTSIWFLARKFKYHTHTKSYLIRPAREQFSSHQSKMMFENCSLAGLFYVWILSHKTIFGVKIHILNQTEKSHKIMFFLQVIYLSTISTLNTNWKWPSMLLWNVNLQTSQMS